MVSPPTKQLYVAKSPSSSTVSTRSLPLSVQLHPIKKSYGSHSHRHSRSVSMIYLSRWNKVLPTREQLQFVLNSWRSQRMRWSYWQAKSECISTKEQSSMKWLQKELVYLHWGQEWKEISQYWLVNTWKMILRVLLRYRIGIDLVEKYLTINNFKC